MTENEAVNKLKQHFEYLKHAWKPHPDYETMEAIGMAIQALEKQVPKKVQLRYIRKFDGFEDGVCPTCGWTVSRDYDVSDDFCPDCGQRLDWSDEE
nr:MAG TPA: Transcription initiation factor IIE, alpha FINGER, Transcription [Caudoviricetes sp.]